MHVVLGQLSLQGAAMKKTPQQKLQYLWNGTRVLSAISSVTEDVIWQKRRKFYKVSLLHAEMVRVMVQKTLFLSERAAVYLLSVKILFANTKNNWVPA